MSISSHRIDDVADAYAAAWSSHDPNLVADMFSEDACLSVNRGEAIVGRSAIVALVTGFYDEFPDLVVSKNEVRLAGDHAVFLWTLEGTHRASGNRVVLNGWEEWELGEDMKIKASSGWFDAEEYERQLAAT